MSSGRVLSVFHPSVNGIRHKAGIQGAGVSRALRFKVCNPVQTSAVSVHRNRVTTKSKFFMQAGSEEYKVHCDCGSVEATMYGVPRVTGICHCHDCRELRQVPFFQVVAYEEPNLNLTKGEDNVLEFQHPTKRMKRIFCKSCGETIYNTNGMNWRIVSQLLVKKSNNNELPEIMKPRAHFFYSSRVIDVNDNLPGKD